jgi:protein-disulfide isomerase
MSRKSDRNRVKPERAVLQQGGEIPPANPTRRRGLVVGLTAALLLAAVVGTLLYKSGATQSPPAATANALSSNHSPTLGDASAKVHVVEFLDPACETCAQFFPLVKQRMVENAGRIRLSVRHVAFHNGSDYVVRILEASRKQDKYWKTLEALLESQATWAPNHTVQPGLVMQAISGVGLDNDQLMIDMTAPEVAQRMEQDRNDAIALKVTATPEYFVNGRPMPSFGEAQLQNLISEALQGAY